MDVKETTCYLPTHDQLVQSVNNTRNALNSVVESTSKLLYLYSKRPSLNVAASNPSVDTGQELARSFEEEVKRLQQSVDLLVNNFVQANRFAEEYRHKVEQQDLEESEQCQQITERLTQLSQQIWKKELKLEECKQRLRSFQESISLQNT
ncbi:hypothetical protein GAYE_SCF15G3585 [Galdieria yellowstonensis]|uniref:Mediator of RNA polymerase II transcription subunit 21 n=1 Tax=Galdieria yellowstonensis TaxID=3028027 RepID=A0AAV9IEJ4_9RHOD|nr:hypothetical protein GAYE_SCF15G3585 [Galdieria yellowstonensis]